MLKNAALRHSDHRIAEAPRGALLLFFAQVRHPF